MVGSVVYTRHISSLSKYGYHASDTNLSSYGMAVMGVSASGRRVMVAPLPNVRSVYNVGAIMQYALFNDYPRATNFRKFTTVYRMYRGHGSHHVVDALPALIVRNNSGMLHVMPVDMRGRSVMLASDIRMRHDEMLFTIVPHSYVPAADDILLFDTDSYIGMRGTMTVNNNSIDLADVSRLAYSVIITSANDMFIEMYIVDAMSARIIAGVVEYHVYHVSKDPRSIGYQDVYRQVVGNRSVKLSSVLLARGTGADLVVERASGSGNSTINPYRVHDKRVYLRFDYRNSMARAGTLVIVDTSGNGRR